MIMISKIVSREIRNWDTLLGFKMIPFLPMAVERSNKHYDRIDQIWNIISEIPSNRVQPESDLRPEDGIMHTSNPWPLTTSLCPESIIH